MRIRMQPLSLMLAILLCSCKLSFAQGNEPGDFQPTSQFVSGISQKASKLENALRSKKDKILTRMLAREQAIQKEMAKTNKEAADSFQREILSSYEEISRKLKSPQICIDYQPYLDTLTVAMKFLRQVAPGTGGALIDKNKVNTTVTKLNALNEEFQRAQQIREFLNRRETALRTKLLNTAFAGSLKSINKDIYYYGQQITDYKALLNDPKRLEKKALAILRNSNFFKDFMRRNSLFASLFRLPDEPVSPNAASFAGLQTRTQVQQLLQQQLAPAGPTGASFVQEQLQTAQSQLDQLKSKLTQFSNYSSDQEIPSFKPNTQKTKTFWQRVELGSNFQSLKSNGILPATSNIALTAGYRLNDKSVAGAGLAYKLGWGPDIRHIRFSHEGVSIRTFLDWKLKGSIFLSGGYELNHYAAFRRIAELHSISAWQQSGLIGVSKVVDTKSKLFKKTKVQLLFDFLSYQQIPRPQPLQFRVGYQF